MAILTKLKIFIEAGGFTSLLIVVTGVILAALTVERAVYLFHFLDMKTGSSIKKIRELVMARQYSQAIQICNQSPNSPELSVMRACLSTIDGGRDSMKSALSYSLIKVNENCEARLSYLALIASGATLLGLLGTISGLISTFAAIASADAGEKARLLGSGISEAMNSTAGGLIVGLAAMVAHTVLASKIDKVLAKSQTAGLGLWTWIEQAERTNRNG